ncbi:hypothetical protein C8F04DRAFT_541994 [Mycena alexandri]|uniref:F-box domain-containing protein n=1 Tax=Mycena alexandri TaxID=1745969 RepID=A0AAD6X1B0_9AGAR|nr:hypothetical protein C8F04DRAFT_541994 [Mycena alexandri]
MSNLPQELIDAILEDVPDSSLAACSLTATSFVVASQRRLFRRMTLSDLPAYERVIRVLVASPHLAQYVRALGLDIRDIPNDSTLIKSIIVPLTKIEYLSIWGGTGATWPDLGQNPWLIDVLSRTTVKFLALERLSGVPSSLIAQAFSSCDEVSLSNVLLSDNGSDGFSAHGAISHFHVPEDVYSTVLPFVLDPKRVGSLHRLRGLSITSLGLDQSITTFLIACSRTLEHLTIRFPPTRLPALPALKVLEIQLQPFFMKSTSVLSAISDSIASSSHLEVLMLSLEERSIRSKSWAERDLSAYAALDSTFIDPDKPHLREIHFCLRWVGVERFPKFIAFIQANFPRTFEAGMMKASHRAAVENPMDRFATVV